MNPVLSPVNRLSSPTRIIAPQLAARLLDGADALARFARTLTEREWRTVAHPDGRTVGIIVHHVAHVYPVEIELAEIIANGGSITGVTMADVHQMNARHAKEFANVTRDEALTLLADNAGAAAAAIRALSDEQLAQAAPASLYHDAPITCQFVLEDHAVRHSYHHLATLKAALGR